MSSSGRYYATHRELVLARQAIARASDPDRFHARHREADARYYDRHREEIRARRATRRADHAARAARRAFGEDVPREAWRRVWAGPCFDCGQTPAEGVDHVVPRARGGRNVLENLQPACLPCNRRKNARVVDIFGARLATIAEAIGVRTDA